MSRFDALDAESDDAETAGRIARLFLSAAGSMSVQRVAGGLSGAAVFACQAEDRKYALKRWPAGTSAARVDEVHEVMLQSRRQLALVPELVRSPLGTTRLARDGYHYELTSWMPGSPFGDDDVSVSGFPVLAKSAHDFQATLAAVAAGAEAIASFHDSVRRWGSVSAPAPAILRRLKRIEQLRTELPLALSHCERLSPTLRTAADWLRSEGVRGLHTAGAMLGRWAGERIPTQIVLRDVHREHILFSAGQPSGLVDFDAVGRDTVATDIARWVSGFVESGTDPRPLWDAAGAGYRRVLPFSACERELAGAISQSSGVILLANWVVWMALEQRDFSGCSDLVDRRVAELMGRMVPT